MTALFELIFVMSLAIPLKACETMTQATTSQPGGARRSRQCHELGAEADEERGLQPEAGADVAAEEIGDDAEDFVEDEQRSHRKRGVAEVVEVEQHQHAGGAVGNGIGPVGRGNQDVVAQTGP